MSCCSEVFADAENCPCRRSRLTLELTIWDGCEGEAVESFDISRWSPAQLAELRNTLACSSVVPS